MNHAFNVRYIVCLTNKKTTRMVVVVGGRVGGELGEEASSERDHSVATFGVQCHCSDDGGLAIELMQAFGHSRRHRLGALDDDAGVRADAAIDHLERQDVSAARAQGDFSDHGNAVGHAGAQGSQHDHGFGERLGGVEGDLVVLNHLTELTSLKDQDLESECEHGGSPRLVFGKSRSQLPRWVNI